MGVLRSRALRTLEEVGEGRGVTRERIRQIEVGARKRLAGRLGVVDTLIGQRPLGEVIVQNLNEVIEGVADAGLIEKKPIQADELAPSGIWPMARLLIRLSEEQPDLGQM